MGIKNEDDNKSPRKPFIYYYLIVMIVMILFNAHRREGQEWKRDIRDV